MTDRPDSYPAPGEGKRSRTYREWIDAVTAAPIGADPTTLAHVASDYLLATGASVRRRRAAEIIPSIIDRCGRTGAVRAILAMDSAVRPACWDVLRARDSLYREIRQAPVCYAGQVPRRSTRGRLYYGHGIIAIHDRESGPASGAPAPDRHTSTYAEIRRWVSARIDRALETGDPSHVRPTPIDPEYRTHRRAYERVGARYLARIGRRMARDTRPIHARIGRALLDVAKDVASDDAERVRRADASHAAPAPARLTAGERAAVERVRRDIATHGRRASGRDHREITKARKARIAAAMRRLAEARERAAEVARSYIEILTPNGWDRVAIASRVPAPADGPLGRRPARIHSESDAAGSPRRRKGRRGQSVLVRR